eukprot:31626-Rhodomonas_salina.1
MPRHGPSRYTGNPGVPTTKLRWSRGVCFVRHISFAPRDFEEDLCVNSAKTPQNATRGQG